MFEVTFFAWLIQEIDIGFVGFTAGAVAFNCELCTGLMFGANLRFPVSISEKHASELKKPHARSPDPSTMALLIQRIWNILFT